MKPPVETVKISARGREILIKVKRNTGIERWNEICRVALCQSLANPTIPPKSLSRGDTAIEIEWKTFAGEFSHELASAVIIRAYNDGIKTETSASVSDYFRSHMERGIASLQNTRDLVSYILRSCAPEK